MIDCGCCEGLEQDAFTKTPDHYEKINKMFQSIVSPQLDDDTRSIQHDRLGCWEGLYDYALMGQQDNAIRSAMWIYLFGLYAGKWTVKVLEDRSSSETCIKWINLCQAGFQDHSIVTQG